MWFEITTLQISKKIFNRPKREWSFGKWIPDDLDEGGTGSDSDQSYASLPTNSENQASYYGQCCACHRVSY